MTCWLQLTELVARFAQPNKTWQRCSKPGSNVNPQRQRRRAPSNNFSVHLLWWQPTLGGREQGQSIVEWEPDPSQGQSCSIHHTTSPRGLRKPTHHGHIHTSKKRFLPKQITQRAPQPDHSSQLRAFVWSSFCYANRREWQTNTVNNHVFSSCDFNSFKNICKSSNLMCSREQICHFLAQMQLWFIY